MATLAAGVLPPVIPAACAQQSLRQDALPASPVQLPGQPLGLRAALAAALADNPSIVISRAAADAAAGVAQQQSGSFDPALTAQHVDTRAIRPLRDSERAALLLGGFDLRYELTDSYLTQAAASRLFENGLQASVIATHTSSWDNALGAAGLPRQNTGVLSFQLRVPLLRNSGQAVGAPLRAAEVEAEAARADIEATAAGTLLAATLAYWDYLARMERLAIAVANERRGEDLLEELRKLIAADELPRADSQLAQASLNDKRSTRIAAEQAVIEARRTLGRALGLEAAAAMAIGAPADRFPDDGPAGASGAPPDASSQARALALQALQTRADLAAARLREQAAAIRVEAARHNEQPQLDLVLSAAQSGLAERASPANAAAAFARNQGPGYGAGLFWQLPLGNNAARGVARQARAAADIERARVRELGYSIENNVEAAAHALQRAAGQLAEARNAAGTYAASLENERIKRRLGMATLIDVLNVEDRYTNALLAEVQARQNHAAAIARFRFETGALIDRDGGTYRARVDGLFTPITRTP